MKVTLPSKQFGAAWKIAVVVALMGVTVIAMIGTSVVSPREGELPAASSQIANLESRFNALGLQDAGVHSVDGGVSVSFIFNGLSHALLIRSVGGATNLTGIVRLVSSEGSSSYGGAAVTGKHTESAVSLGPGIKCGCGCLVGCGGGDNAVVTFDESSLPSGAPWNVTVDDGSNYVVVPTTTGSTDWDVFSDGTYSYQAVSGSGNYGYYTTQGSFTVAGSTAVSTAVPFTQVIGSPPSGLSTGCWTAIIESGIESAFLVAAIVGCATTGVGCLVLYFLVNFEGVSIPLNIATACHISV